MMGEISQMERRDHMTNTRTLAQISQKIKKLEKRTIQNVIEIGKLLHEASEKCEHGEYKNWLKSEFSWSDQTALNYRHVYALTQKPNSLDFAQLNISISAVYFIARMLKDGQELYQAAAKAIIAAAKKDRVTYPIAIGIWNKYISEHQLDGSDETESDETESDEAESDEAESEDAPEPTADGDELSPLRFDDKVGHALRNLIRCIDEDWTESAKTITRDQHRQIISLLELAYTARVGDPVKLKADRAEASAKERALN
jgi:hypothetical protein